ncbi:MAG: dihydroxy-acid dehydratase [Proteobacteria bacterium]|nr:dihydroxy-acid dehydratase [Pseudomonadota bacterium]
MSDKKQKRRSQHWFGGTGLTGYVHRSWMRNQGRPDDFFDGRPVIGICNTWSELTPCNGHFRELAEKVKIGIYEAGGVPVEFPVTSLGETLMRPTTMMFRNLVSMDVEESIRANPMDGVVLLTGCDKTTPALMMGAASCDLPTMVLSGGPMLNGKFKGQDIGSGTHIFKFQDEVAAGTMSRDDFLKTEAGMSRSIGHCMTMGTASTMASMAEALGIALPGNAAIPAADANRGLLAQMVGRRIVKLVDEDVKMSRILTRDAFANAIKVNGAIGGSTNAVVHLLAIAGRLGIDLTLDDWDTLGAGVPTLVNLFPSGSYLMEDFYYAGGLPVVMKRIAAYLNTNALTVSGGTVAENIADAECYDDDVIRPLDKPLTENGGIAVLRGNLAPQGAIIKPSAASETLMSHTGRAVVFEDMDDYRSRIRDSGLDVTKDDILVLKNNGPVGYPGFPETGNLALPPKILQDGVRDMVRISDARMSGTAFGTVVLHVAPEAAVGGPLALVQTGDRITLDVPGRRLQLHVPDEELAARRKSWQPPAIPEDEERGYAKLYRSAVTQADTGADFDFLIGKSGAKIPKSSH